MKTSHCSRESDAGGGDKHYCVLRQVPTVGSFGPCFPTTNGIILVASLVCLPHHWHWREGVSKCQTPRPARQLTVDRQADDLGSP